MKSLLYYFTAFSTITFLFFVNERLDIDFEQLWFTIVNFQDLQYINASGVGINSVTTRFFEVLKSLSMSIELIGNGLGEYY